MEFLLVAKTIKVYKAIREPEEKPGSLQAVPLHDTPPAGGS